MEDYLMHHGILGMKWGIRRYQNADGSLTSEGKRHYEDYKKQHDLGNRLRDETRRVINSSDRLKEEFKDTSIIDDNNLEMFDIDAWWYVDDVLKSGKMELGRKGMEDFENLNKTFRDLYNSNYESIKIGRKIYEKILRSTHG